MTFLPRPSHSRALVLLVALLLASCVRTEFRYRDTGTDAHEVDAATVDAPGLDANLDGEIDAAIAEDTGPVMIGADATRAVLDSIGTRVIMPLLVQFEADAAALEAATDAWSASPSDTTRDAARAAWRTAMATWQHLEMLQVGPAGLFTTTVAGRGLRDEIFAWPLVSRCRIDQETTEAAFADAALLGVEAVNVRGLAAIEYLLFYDAPDNGCGPTHSINMDGVWAALGDAEVARRRTVYAHAAAVLVHQRATELRTAWDPAGPENFLGTLRTAGAGSTVFATAQAGLNAVSDALFYLYKEVTDNKLGIPAGLRIECTTDICPEAIESLWARASLDHVRANLEAFRDAYLGAPPAIADAPGFDDLLRSIGATTLDDQIQTAIAACFTALDAVEGPLEAALILDHPDVVLLHEALRALGTLFKVDVITLLDLELPTRLEGDAD